MVSDASAPLVRMTGITKRFGRITVLDDVSFDLRPGEVHVLAGENGAGKSTLIKILAGVHTDFEGRIEVAGCEVRPRSPIAAASMGIAVIHQELSLIGSMSVADNLFLGRMQTRAGLVCDRDQERDARTRLQQLGLDVDVRRPVEQLPIATQQGIEIAKALSRDAKAIVMDEPTSALGEPDVERLFGLVDQLTGQGCGVVYISHKMEEIERIADRITVLRDGRHVGTAPAAELPTPKLIQWMVGRDMDDQLGRHRTRAGEPRLTVSGFRTPPRGRADRRVVNEVSFHVGRGEVLGIGGLQGSGASELMLALFGGRGICEGSVILDGERLEIASPRQAIDAGIAYLTNDRKATGLVLPLSIIANTSLASLSRVSRFGWRRPVREREAARETASSLQVRAASLDMPVSSLSGGNQQKVAIAKWLQTEPNLLLLDEPTRGIDVGAKHEIYELMDAWTARGISILLITSEMPELLALSDRIMVMHRGRVTAEFTREQATAETVLAAAMGSTDAG